MTIDTSGNNETKEKVSTGYVFTRMNSATETDYKEVVEICEVAAEVNDNPNYFLFGAWVAEGFEDDEMAKACYERARDVFVDKGAWRRAAEMEKKTAGETQNYQEYMKKYAESCLSHEPPFTLTAAKAFEKANDERGETIYREEMDNAVKSGKYSWAASMARIIGEPELAEKYQKNYEETQDTPQKRRRVASLS